MPCDVMSDGSYGPCPRLVYEQKEEIGEDLDFLPALRARAERHNAEIRRRKAQGSIVDLAYIQGCVVSSARYDARMVEGWH